MKWYDERLEEAEYLRRKAWVAGYHTPDMDVIYDCNGNVQGYVRKKDLEADDWEDDE